MNKLFILLFTLISIWGQSQTIIPFQNENGKWGLKSNENKVLIKAIYDRLENSSYNSYEAYQHNVLAAIIDDSGNYIFEANAKTVKGSNAFLRYQFAEFSTLNTLQEEIDSSIFLYFSEAIMDTILFTDSIEDINEETREFELIEIIMTSVVGLKEGKISVINSKGVLLNKKAFDNIAISTPYTIYRDDSEVWQMFFKLKNNENPYGIYPMLPLIERSNFIFEQNNKWGLFSIEKGVLVDPIYDSLEVGNNTFVFYNHKVLAAIVDLEGNYLFKPDEKLVKNSNAYFQYGFVNLYDLASTQEKIDNSLFIYISNAVLDTLIFTDSIDIEDFETGEIMLVEETLNRVTILKEGKISIVNSDAKTLNKKPFENIAVETYFTLSSYYNYGEDIWRQYFKLNNNESYYGVVPKLPLITKGNILFQKNNKWGLFSLTEGVLIEPTYDDFKEGNFQSIEFYKHNVLALIVNSKGNNIFKPAPKLVESSNIVKILTINLENNNDTTRELELSNQIFLYITDGQIDTLNYIDSVKYFDYDNDEIINSASTIKIPIISKGEINIINGNGKKLNSKPLEDISFLAMEYTIEYGEDPVYGEIVFYGYSETGNNNYVSIGNSNNKGIELKNYFTNGTPNLQSKSLLYKENGKWGLLHIDKGILIEAKYDSYTYEKELSFYNQAVLACKIDNHGNYIFKVNKEIIDNSNAYMELSICTNAQNNPNDKIYFYLSDAIIDTLIIEDTITALKDNYWEEIRYLDTIAIIKVIKRAGVYILNSKGESLNNIAYDDVYYFANKNELAAELYYNEIAFTQLNYGRYISLKADETEIQNDKMYFVRGWADIYSGILYARKGDTWTVIDINNSSQNEISKEKIDLLIFTKDQKLSAMPNGLFTIEKDQQFGLINSKGDILQNIKFAEIKQLENHFFRTSKNNYYGENDYYEYQSYGLLDSLGNEIIPCKYLSISEFKEGLAIAEECIISDNDFNNRKCKYGCINTKGEVVIQFLYDDIYMPYNGKLIAEKDNKYGLIDNNANELSAFRYDLIIHYYNITYLAYIGDLSEQKEPLDGFWGIIDKSGNELTPIKYSSITLFGSNGYVVEDNNKFGLLDSNGQEITPIIYSEIKEVNQGYAKVLQNNRWGIIDSIGNEIIACENLFVSDLNDTVFYVYSKDKLYSANLNGEYVQELFFGKTETINKGLVRILVSEIYYSYYNSFEEDYGTTLYGIADTSDNVIIQCIYDEIYVFENSFAVKTNDKWFYLDKNGKRINNASYDDISKLNDRMAIYTIIETVDGDSELHYGYINAYGKRLTKYVFKYAEDFIDGKAKVSIDGEEYFFIDEKGKRIK